MNTQDKSLCASLESYMLGELDDAAMFSFERHMSGCSVCQTNVDLLWPTHDILAYEEPGETDAEWAAAMKDRVLATVLGTRPIRVGDSVSDQTTRVNGRMIEHPDIRKSVVRRRRTPLRLSIYTVSAATLLIGIVVGSSLGGGWWRMGNGAAVATTQVLTDVSMKPTVSAPLAYGTVMLLGTEKGQEVIITVHGLQPLPSSQCYNVWFVAGADKRILAGMLTVNGSGTGALSAMVPTDLAFHYVGITREPHLNDVVPKGPKVLGALLTTT